MTWHQGITGGVGAAALVASAVIWFLSGWKWARYIAIGCAITGMAGILNTGVGAYLGDAVNRVGELVSSLASTYGVGVAVAMGAAALVVFTVKRLVQGRSDPSQLDERTWGMAAGIPLVAGAIPGPLGVGLTWLLGIVTWPFVWAI